MNVPIKDTNFLFVKLKGLEIKNDYKYIIFSQRLSNQENSSQQWEGVLGEYKNIIKREIKQSDTKIEKNLESVKQRIFELNKQTNFIQKQMDKQNKQMLEKMNE